MKSIILVLLVTGGVIACKKDKFTTRPKIEVSSYNTKTVAPQQNLIIQLKFTDKEGDISEGKFVYIPVRTNKRPLPPDLVLDSVDLNIPKFPNNNTGFYELRLPWSYLQRSPVENDTFYFRFVAIDRGGNKSDTVNSAQVVALHP
jgi:hypothetical protein